MKVINVQEAKTHLSRLIEEAVGGECILLAKHGKPLVKLSAYTPEQGNRPLGGFEGRIRISEDFDAEDARVQALFHGS
jgi:prevent-host-death family protein